MDPGGPGSRAGRTFWTFWNYITDIVGRFLRAEPPGTVINAADNTNSTPTNDELLDSHHKKDNATEEREEVHAVPASSVGSTRPVVLWDSGSALQPEMRQNVVQEDDKINENDDEKDKAIETGNDVAAYQPISLTTMDNPEQSSDTIINNDKLMLVDSLDEMINIDIEVSKQYGSIETDKPQSKEQLNAIPKEGFNEQKTSSAAEPELTSEDTRTLGQKHCEQHDGKLLLSDNMDLGECVPIIEKQKYEEAETEESANVKSDRDGNKNVMEGTEEIEIKNMTDEDQYSETEMCLQTTHLELTRQNTCMIKVTDRSGEGLNRMNTEDMKKTQSLVLETENVCKQDDISEAYEDNKDEMAMVQNNLDIEKLERLSDMESLMPDNNYVIMQEEDETPVKQELTVTNTTDDPVKSEDDEKESEIQKEESEMTEYDNVTNKNATFDAEDENNAIINQDMTQPYTLKVVAVESSTKELKDMNKDDFNKLHPSLVLETENMSEQDDKNEVHDGNKDDTVLTQSNLDIENLEKLSDMESLMSDNNYVIRLEENESLIKQELTVANTTDDSVKSEDDEKESEIQKEESEMTEYDNITSQNAAFDSEDGNNDKETCPEPIVDLPYTLEVADGQSSTKELKDMNKDHFNKLHTSLVLETENMSKQDDKNEVHDGNKDDMVLTQSNLDRENLERLSDIESSMSNNNYVTVLEENESLIKQELTVASTTDDSVKSEDDEKEIVIQKEETGMTENDDDNMTNQNAAFDCEDGNNAKETCPALIINNDITQADTLEAADGESSTEQSNDMTKDNLNRLHTSLVLETEDMSKQDDKNEVHDGNKDDVVLMQHNLDIENLETLSDMESSMSDNNYAIMLEEDESLVKYERTVANTTDDSVKSEDDEKESEIQKEEIEMTENDDDNMTNKNATFESEDENNVIIDQGMIQPYTLEVADGESSTEESKDVKKDDGNKDDMVLTQNNVDIENLERLSDMESSMSNSNYVIVLEDKKSLIKQELAVSNTSDDSVKSESDEKENKIQKDESEMTEYDNLTSQNSVFDSEDGNNAKETCPEPIVDLPYTLEVADVESSTEESKNVNKDFNNIRTFLCLETENMSKQDDKNEVHDGNKDDMVLMQNNLDTENLERLSDMESSMSENNSVTVLEENESLIKQELTVASTTDDSVKSEDDEKEIVIQKEETGLTENDDDNMTNQNAAFDSKDGNNAKETCPALIINNDITQADTLEVADGESSTEQSNDMTKDNLNRLHMSLVLETENMSKQDDKNEVHDGNKDDVVLMQNNLDIENLERLSDMESSMSNSNYVIVLEDKESPIKQELAVANGDSVKSESDEKENKIQKEESEMTEYDNLTSQNSVFDSEDGNDAKETCPEPIVDLPYTLEVADVESCTEESKDMNKDFNKLHTCLGLETEILSILDNQTVQDESSKVQVTDECNIIQEVEPSTSKQEHTAANGNEESYGNSENKKPGKMEQDIFEEESDNKDFKTKGITPNMEDAAIVGRETHISRCGLDFEGIFYVADPASSEMDSSMGKFDVIIKSEGGPAQEQAIAFKNISPGEGEGQERPYSYKESREEVPDYNNEPNNGSATQRFLEVANCRENQTTLLQEEVESRAAKHLQTSATSEGEDSLEDPMETQLIKNSLEEHIAEKTQLPDKLMKTTSEYSNFETNFVHADVEEKGEDLKEAKREIGFEMGKHVCDIDTVDADVEIQTEFQNLSSLDQSEYNVQMLERPSVAMQTTRMDLLDTEGLFTFEEEVTTVKKISDGSSESVKSGSADEDCTTVSNDNVIPDGVHYKISPDALSVEDEHQKCVLEQQKFDDVIEDEILDLWIQHTSMESSEVSEEDQGHEHSQCKMPEEEKVESMPDLSIECDVNVSLFTNESGFSDQSLDMESLPECNKDEQDLLQEEKIINVSCILNKSEGLNESSLAEPELETPWREDLGTSPERTDDGEEAPSSQNIDLSTPVMQDNSTSSAQMDDKPFTTLETISEPETLSMDQSDFFTEIKNTICTTDTSETEECQLLVQDKSKVEALLEFERTEDIDKVEVKELDFTPQKSRIAVKNPRVRPPKDFRSLLHKPSFEPSPSKPLASHVPAGVPMGGLGIGIKLPGLGTGFPILKKTKKTVEEETQTPTQETEPVIEDDNKAKQEDSPQRPKWMPASHPGFGNPLLSELKSKLKKTTKE